jgi:hypothetical protein
MIRRIVTTQLQVADSGGHEVDTFFDRVVKYIPTEIVSAWVAAKALVGAAAVVSKNTVLWVCFGAAVVLTALWTLKQTSLPGKPHAVTQTFVATVAFIVWAIALGEPFATLLGTARQSLYGGLLLIFYTLIAGLITPKEV